MDLVFISKITGQFIETNPLSAVFLGQNVFTHFFVQGLEVVAVNFELSKKMKLE